MIKNKKKDLEKEIKYFDIHSHLHSDFFNEKEDGEKISDQMKKEKIFSTIIGVSLKDSKKAIELSSKKENLFCSIGIHPTEKEDFDFDIFQKMINEDNEKKIVCVGECGLDYYWPKKDFEKGKINEKELLEEVKRQKMLFMKQIDFAQKNFLPLMLHIRSFEKSDAHFDAFKILEKKQKEFINNDGKKIKANFHFFTEENEEVVKWIIDNDYNISFPGVVTFANLDKIVSLVPVEKIMIETDSPFAAPKKYRGKTNIPIYVQEVSKKISEIKRIPEEKIREVTVKNSINFFNL